MEVPNDPAARLARVSRARATRASVKASPVKRSFMPTDDPEQAIDQGLAAALAKINLKHKRRTGTSVSRASKSLLREDGKAQESWDAVVAKKPLADDVRSMRYIPPMVEQPQSFTGKDDKTGRSAAPAAAMADNRERLIDDLVHARTILNPADRDGYAHKWPASLDVKVPTPEHRAQVAEMIAAVEILRPRGSQGSSAIPGRAASPADVARPATSLAREKLVMRVVRFDAYSMLRESFEVENVEQVENVLKARPIRHTRRPAGTKNTVVQKAMIGDKVVARVAELPGLWQIDYLKLSESFE